MINEITTIIILAITVEALVEYYKIIFNTVAGRITVNKTQIGAIAVAILLAVGAQIDLFKILGITFVIPYLGVVLTGIIFSRGSNYVASFVKLADEKISTIKANKG